jgi:IS5 family transposase
MRKTLFGEEFRLDRIENKDPLVRLKQLTDWSVFEKMLEDLFPQREYPAGGRPAYPKLLLFKIVFLQEYYGLSDEGVEFQINDRLSFMRFLDLTLDDRVPDRNTIWNFKESLKDNGGIDRLFEGFVSHLRSKGFIVNKGSIIDASIVSAPIQRNSRDENDQINKGVQPDWDEKKASHKDIDARWTSKNGKNYFGYKNHVKVDAGSKLITRNYITEASTHDSKVLALLVDEHDSGHRLFADSAYHSADIRVLLKALNIHGRIQSKGHRSRKLTGKEMKRNSRLAKTRCRVEHVFGTMTKLFRRVQIRCIGIARAARDIIMKNLVYNIQRSTYLMG